MKRMINAVRIDMLFQFRSGFHTIYSVLSLIYIIALNEMPDRWIRVGVPFVIFSDPAMVGLFFVGGLVMLEKEQGIIDLISVTPTRITEYLLGKVLSLSLISLAAGFTIAVFTYQSFSWVVLLLAIVAASIMYSLLGFVVAMHCRTVNQYFGKMIPLMIGVAIPLISLVGFPYSWLFYILPSVGSARLFVIAFFGGNLQEVVVCLMSTSFWTFLFGRWAVRSFADYSTGGGMK